MQSYFNYYDVNIETDAVIDGNSARRFLVKDIPEPQVGETHKFFILVGLMVIFAMVLKVNLTSSQPIMAQIKSPKTLIHNFTVEVPRPEPPKVKKMPEKKTETPLPKDRRPPARRAAPEMYASTEVPDRVFERNVETAKKREKANEQAVVREIPAVQTPVIEASASVRQKATDQARPVTAVISGDTTRQYEYADIEVRDAPTMEVSHSQLDPYHYQMVDLCLRLCAQSLFLCEGIGIPESKYSAEWLRIDKTPSQNALLINLNGRWIKLAINKNRLKVLTDISFVEIPADYAAHQEELEEMVEGVTRKLCRLLSHEECFENL